MKLKVKVGLEGQIIIPKALREAYRIEEGEIVYIEPCEGGILIRKAMDPYSVISWIREKRKRVQGKNGQIRRSC